jgi:hypothetical protein
MFRTHHRVERRIRGAVKNTRRALDRALDAAEPRLEAAAVELQRMGGDTVATLRQETRRGLARIDAAYGHLTKRFRRERRRSVAPGKLVLLGAGIGVAALTFGLLHQRAGRQS